ncbi:cuticle protein 7-like [Scylla paramamosain]|uniref:cuticle protein 7-like n=1 Tax=Scylla paramamosain TaxID=85552 RepID=UPI003083AEA3
MPRGAGRGRRSYIRGPLSFAPRHSFSIPPITMTCRVALLLSLVVVAAARPSTTYSDPTPSYQAPAHPTPSYHAPAHPSPSYHAPAPSYHSAEQHPDVPPQYSSNYAVKDDYSGNDFAGTETRDGYNTQGSYQVLLPDGRLQTVTYYVDGDSGFVAEVSYEGEAQYPETYGHAPAPSYGHAPAPSYGHSPAPSYGDSPAPSYTPAPVYSPAPSYHA